MFIHAYMHSASRNNRVRSERRGDSSCRKEATFFLRQSCIRAMILKWKRLKAAE